MRVKLNIDTTGYESKDAALQNIEKIKRDMIVEEQYRCGCELEQIGECVTNGYTVMLAYYCYQFMTQQVFAIDINNDCQKQISIEDAVKKVEQYGFKPFLIYETFSSSKEKLKFRMFFALSEEINSIQFSMAIQKFLTYCIFENGEINQECIGTDRLFFGTNKGIYYSDYNAITNSYEIFPHIIKATRENRLEKADTSIEKVNTIVERPTIEPIDGTNDNVKAIKEHDVEYLRSKLNQEPKEFDTKEEFWSYIHNRDMMQLLGLGNRCNCPFHNDTEQSASVFKSKDGAYLFKCHCNDCRTDGATLTVKNIIELLGDFQNISDTVNFIKEIYNVSIKDGTDGLKAELNEIKRHIGGVFKDSYYLNCVQTAANVRKAMRLFETVLQIAEEHIYLSNESNGIYIYCSNKQLADKLQYKGNSKTQGHLKLLIYHKLIEVVNDNDANIPKELLAKVLSIQRESRTGKHMQIYKIPFWNTSHLLEMEKRGKQWKENKYRWDKLTYEVVMESDGIEMAAELFPQYSKQVYANRKNNLPKLGMASMKE